MKRLAVLAVSILLAAAPLALAAPARAGTPGCVTRAEFRNVSKGMRQQTVNRIFDARGSPDRSRRSRSRTRAVGAVGIEPTTAGL